MYVCMYIHIYVIINSMHVGSEKKHFLKLTSIFSCKMLGIIFFPDKLMYKVFSILKENI